MNKKWKSVTVTTALSAALLLGITAAPCAADFHNGHATAEIHTSAPSQTQKTATSSTDGTAKPADAAKKQKSVFDADALQSPFSFLKDTPGTNEESNDITIASSTVVLALKALAATLLSTIM